MRFEDGITAQPEVLARSARAVTEGLSRVAALHPDDLVALVGIGA